MRLISCTLILTLLAAPSFACVTLDHAEPRVGSTLTSAPKQVTLYFNGAIFPEKSTVSVLDAQGKDQTAGKPFGTEQNGEIEQISVPVTTLKPGRYKVSWSVLCDCGSMNPGDYPFTVQ